MLDGAEDELGKSVGSAEGRKEVFGLPVGAFVSADVSNDTVGESLG